MIKKTKTNKPQYANNKNSESTINTKTQNIRKTKKN